MSQRRYSMFAWLYTLTFLRAPIADLQTQAAQKCMYSTLFISVYFLLSLYIAENILLVCI